MLEILCSKLLDLFIDSISIGGMFWLFLLISLKIINKRFARFRYHFSLFVFFGLFIMLVIISFGYISIYDAWLKPKVLVIVDHFTGKRILDFDLVDTIRLFVLEYYYYLWILWFFGFTIYLVKLFFQSRAIKSIQESGISDYGLTLLKSELVNKIGIHKEVSFKFMRNGSHPFTIGYYKPIIYFPIEVITGFTSEELELILFHELIHIKRNDYLINLIQLCIEAIFFFNPFIRHISKVVKDERESSCDYDVISNGYSKLLYAKALERSYTLHYNLVLNFGNQNVFSRIKNLTWFQISNNSQNRLRIFFLRSVFMCFMFLILGAGISVKHSFYKSQTIAKSTKIYPRIEFRNDTTFFMRDDRTTLYKYKDSLVAYSVDGVFENEELKNFERKVTDKGDYIETLIIDKVTGNILEKMGKWKEKSDWKTFEKELKERCLIPDGGYSYSVSPFNVFYINRDAIPEDLQKKYASFIYEQNTYTSEDLVFINQMIVALQKDGLVDSDFEKVKVFFTPKSNGVLLLNNKTLSKKYADKYYIYIKKIFKETLYEDSKYFIK